MTYGLHEQSTEDGAPIELYELSAPGYETYRYTSAPGAISRLGYLYTPKAMERSRLKVPTHEGDDHYLEITLPSNDPYVLQYGVRVAPVGMTVTIYRYHAGDSPDTAYALWRGPVTAITLGSDTATVRTASEFGSILSGNLPSVYFQAPCNWTLYDSQCKVLREQWVFQTTVTAVADNVITIAAWDPAFAGVSFLGGEIVNVATGERRQIALRTDLEIVIPYPFASIKAGDQVELAAGCNHTFSDCKDKFNNATEYGGDRFVPWINIFESGL